MAFRGLTFLSNLIAFAFCILFPNLAKIRAGTTNLVRFLAGTPALFVVALDNLLPDINAGVLAVGVVAFAIVLTVVAITGITKIFRSDVLLAS